MDISYPETKCEVSPVEAHYYIVLTDGICVCRYCLKSVWLPRNLTDAINLTSSILKLGLQKAYKKALKDKPLIMEALTILEQCRQDGTLTSIDQADKVIKSIVPGWFDNDEDVMNSESANNRSTKLFM